MHSSITRAVFVVFCCVLVACQAYSRMELEDRMQMSRFHEPAKSAAVGPMGGADDTYLRYLSEYFGRPMQRRAAPIAFAPMGGAVPATLLDTM